MNELALFAGAGGGILGGKLLGWRTVCAVEIDAYARAVLLARQRDGLLPRFPVWDDVRTFDGKPWRGTVQVVSGGFPCQDISAAGTGDGLDGERSGLWVEMARVIDEVRPRFAFVENSPMLTSRGLGTILGDLAALGYDAEWGVLGAADVGAPHQRDRMWIVAYAAGEQHEGAPHARGRQRQTEGAEELSDLADTNEVGRDRRTRLLGKSGWAEPADGCNEVANPDRERLEKQHTASEPDQTRQHPWGVADIGGNGWWTTEPPVGRVAHGVARRVDRLKCLGNGQVPRCAAEAWRRLILRGI